SHSLTFPNIVTPTPPLPIPSSSPLEFLRPRLKPPPPHLLSSALAFLRSCLKLTACDRISDP
ncbi:hypothetical protein TIFTF001_055808, partial [Ficus carica]